MKLYDYFKKKKIHIGAFCHKIGAHISTIHRKKHYDVETFQLKTAIKIYIATNGHVGFHDMLCSRDLKELIEGGWLVEDENGEYNFNYKDTPSN